LKSFSELADSVKYSVKGSRVLLNDKDQSLETIGMGRSAFAFKIKSTDKVIKVFFPQYVHIAREEAEIYNILQGVPYYPALYESGKNYLVIDYIEGHTFFSCLEKGMPITTEHINEVDEALKLARKKGLNPSDVHLRNIFITTEGCVKMIDVARFRQSKTCRQWNDLKAAFYKIYARDLFPKKIPTFLLNLIALLYKKKLLPRLA
jgi:predicted Ser/Thr protein kinase